MDWLPEFNWLIQKIVSTTETTDNSEKDKIKTNVEKLFKTNQIKKNTEIKIHLKPGHLPKKLKARPIQYHLQSYVEKKLNKVIQTGCLEKIQKAEDCFVSSVVITLEKDKSVKVAMEKS